MLIYYLVRLIFQIGRKKMNYLMKSAGTLASHLEGYIQ